MRQMYMQYQRWRARGGPELQQIFRRRNKRQMVKKGRKMADHALRLAQNHIRSHLVARRIADGAVIITAFLAYLVLLTNVGDSNKRVGALVAFVVFLAFYAWFRDRWLLHIIRTFKEKYPREARIVRLKP